jgi:hypothetical protein
MALTSTPYGVLVISDQTGLAPRPLRIESGIASGYASNIFKGQPVLLSATTGTLQAVTNPGGTPQAIYGIFFGCEYTPLGGRPTESPFWPAGTVIDPTQDFHVYITPCWQPSIRLQCQADGSVAQAGLGSGFNFTNLGAGSTFTGLSACTVGAAGVPSGSQAQLALTEFYEGVNSTIGDAFTDLILTNAYPQIGFRGQNSIG